MSPLIHPQQLGAALHDEDICPQEFMFGLHSFESPLLPPPPPLHPPWPVLQVLAQNPSEATYPHRGPEFSAGKLV